MQIRNIGKLAEKSRFFLHQNDKGSVIGICEK